MAAFGFGDLLDRMFEFMKRRFGDIDLGRCGVDERCTTESKAVDRGRLGIVKSVDAPTELAVQRIGDLVDRRVLFCRGGV